MKKKLLTKILFLVLLTLTSKVQAQSIQSPSHLQTRGLPGWYLILRSDDGIDGNSLFFGEDRDLGERITSSPIGAKYGPPNGLNFITGYKIRMYINNSGDVLMENRLRVMGTLTASDNMEAQRNLIVGDNLTVNKNLTTNGTLEATSEPVKIARLHIDPYNRSDGYSNAGIFFGGASYSEASTGIGSSINGYSGPQNGLNFWAQGNLAMAIDSTGRVGVGVNPVKEECETVKLVVNGYIRAKGLLRSPNKNKSWPDYVFDKNYNLISLTKLEDYIRTNKHLPHIPSAEKMDSESAAVDLYEVIENLTKTIEEQTLYIIDINKRLKQLEKLNSHD